MRTQITVQRFNPDRTPEHFVSNYSIECDRGTTLLSALLHIKNQIDGTLTFRASCRAAICGSCLMQVNGVQKLACRVSLHEELETRGRLEIGPMANMLVIKDMVVELASFWKKIKAITPYVVADEGAASGAPTRQRAQQAAPLQNIHEELHNADGCIMCAACLSACATFEVSPGFLGPAALAKAYRFVVDPRDKVRQDRLMMLQEDHGIWDCVRCNFCVSVCPKEVAPMEQIVRLRRLSIAAGLNESVEAAHITQFTKVVGEEGRLNETRLPVLMLWGHWRKLFRMIPLAIKMFLRGKAPFPFKRPKGYKQVQAIFKSRTDRNR
ncbi:MAG: succinate dehydrogenase iron-sulfur subunit [Nitrospirae bacterium]|nr:succinate dehydrogenase iron-sulfur subunit [Candidatus Troglogloeales bacterium]MBI3598295.1 succinate dehydrogenase iron-sulfur subunit [Candidatus Troglogloeales bacterium]